MVLELWESVEEFLDKKCSDAAGDDERQLLRAAYEAGFKTACSEFTELVKHHIADTIGMSLSEIDFTNVSTTSKARKS